MRLSKGTDNRSQYGRLGERRNAYEPVRCQETQKEDGNGEKRGKRWWWCGEKQM